MPPKVNSARQSRSQSRNNQTDNEVTVVDDKQEDLFTKLTDQFNILTNHDQRAGTFGELLYQAIELSIDKAVNKFQPIIDNHTAEITALKEESIITESRITSLESAVVKLRKEIVELKEYSYSNNLVIDGIQEHRYENVEHKVMGFFARNLGIPYPEDMIIDTCHRMGRSNNNKPRPIIIRFVKRSDKMMVLQQGKYLANTRFHMWEHLPAEIKEERKDLFRERKERKGRGERVVVRGSRLVVDDVIVRDINKEKAKKVPKVERVNNRAAQLMKSVKATQQQIVDGSTFKGHFIPIESKNDIDPALMAVKAVAQTSSATHNVWAVVLGDHRESDDDGEHTAGSQLLQTLVNSGKQGIVVVARYYSGHDIGEKRFTAIKEVGKMAIDNY